MQECKRKEVIAIRELFDRFVKVQRGAFSSDRGHHGPLRTIIGPVLTNHPNSALADLR